MILRDCSDNSCSQYSVTCFQNVYWLCLFIRAYVYKHLINTTFNPRSCMYDLQNAYIPLSLFFSFCWKWARRGILRSSILLPAIHNSEFINSVNSLHISKLSHKKIAILSFFLSHTLTDRYTHTHIHTCTYIHTKACA